VNPQTSTEYVITVIPMDGSDAEGNISIQLGPFNNSEQHVTAVDIVIHTTTIPGSTTMVVIFISLSIIRQPASGRLTFNKGLVYDL